MYEQPDPAVDELEKLAYLIAECFVDEFERQAGGVARMGSARRD
jgi:hypothetical protein